MSWYAQMMKSQELARERNRRDARRVESERHGPQFVAKYKIAALDKEKKIIEKELERIRKGVHRPPRLADTLNTKGNHVLTIPSPRLSEHKTHINSINPEYSKDENKLYDAILFLQNNPSALVPILSAHAQSDAYFETLERVTPRLANDFSENDTIRPRYLREAVSRAEKDELVNKYTILLHRHSPELRRSSPLLNRQRNSPIHKESPLIHDIPHDSPVQNDLHTKTPVKGLNSQELVDQPDGRKSVFMTNFDETSRDSKTPASADTPKKSRQPLPIGKLADSGMSTARDNVSQRLAGNDDNQTSDRKQQATDKSEMAASSSEPKHTEDKRAKQKVESGLFPALNPERYNADGTLRTCYLVEPLDVLIEQAKNARYLRTKERTEQDKELTVQEIFKK